MMGTLMLEGVLFITAEILKEHLNLRIEVYGLSC